MKRGSIFIGLLAILLLSLESCIPQAVVETTPGPASLVASEVQSVDVLLGQGSQGIRTVVRVALPNACYRLGDAVVEQQGRKFTVTIPSQAISSQNCGSIPITQDQVIVLSAVEPAAGNYVVLVNGFLSTFSIPAAPTPLPTATAVPTLTAPVPSPTPLPTLALSPTLLPTATAIVFPSPVPTATLLPLAVGKDPASCVNKAAFYGDLNIPDGMPFEPNSEFVKTWLVMNVGTCTWGSGYQLVFAGGNLIGAQQKVPLPQAAPRQVVQVSIDMTAPVPPGSYTSQWAIESPDGYRFGMGNPAVLPLSVKINVVPRPAGLPSNLDCGAVRLTDMEAQVLDQINTTRASFGLYPLTLVEDISQVALKHSLEMACNNRMSHYGLDGMLYNVRLQRDGILFATSNEIIYAGNGGPAGSLKWWMNSPIHRPIVLTTKYTQVGIGYVFYGRIPYQQRITVDFIHP